MTITQQNMDGVMGFMNDLERQVIIDILDAILDVSIDCTKGEIIHLIKNQRDMLERRKG